MRLVRIEFTNFRCFRSEVIEFGDYTSLVGPNNCGKSTVLRALIAFFGGSTKSSAITDADFYVGADPVAQLSIKFHFADVAGAAADELSHYVRNGRVTFEIVADRDVDGAVTSRCRGIRYGLLILAPFFAMAKAADRKPIYENLRNQFPEIPEWKNLTQAEAALREFELARVDQHVAIESDENAYGIAGPVPKLRKYLEWIYIPAVKDASTEATEQRDSAFSKLILFAVRSKFNFTEQINAIKSNAANALQDLMNGAADVLKEVGAEIDREFKNLTTTPVEIAIDWKKVEGIVVQEPGINSVFKDGMVWGSPETFGHGLQRTYLMALLALAAKAQNNNDDFRLLLGVEEPELYQHPPQARFLAAALADLSLGKSQVIVTTHSPHFVTGRTFESIRTLRKQGNATKVHSWSIDEQRHYCAVRKGAGPIGATAALSGMDRSLQPSIAEMFFAGKVVLVEGAEDMAILESYLKKINKFSEFLRHGGHIIPVGGKTKMHNLIALARGFSIDIFCVCDFDLNQPPNKQANGDIIRYAADAKDIIPQPVVAEFSGAYFYGWHSTIQHSLKAEIEEWSATMSAIADQWGWTLDRMEKDPMLLAETVSRVFEARGEIPPLKRVCDRIELFWNT